LIERNNLASATVIHATSETEENAIRRFHLKAPVRLIPNGVDLVSPNHEGGVQLRKKLGIAETDPVVVYLGRIAPLKRIDLRGGALGLVRKKLPAAKLLVAGPDEGNHLAALKPMFDALGKPAHVLGEVDAEEKQSLFAAADVLVCCSESESFGLSIAE